MGIPLIGNVKDISLAEMLVYLNRKRKTGTLTFKISAFTKKIFLNQGDAIFASSTYEDDRLGEMLLKAGKITVEQYDESVRLLKSSKKRQGAILIELGYLTPKDLFWGVKYQVKTIIHSLFLLENAEYEFKEGDLLKDEVITLKMSMGNLIYEGIKKIENWIIVKNKMPGTDAVFKLSDDPRRIYQDIEMTDHDKKIISLIDGKRTIKEIVDSSWMGPFEALKMLYVLWLIGMIEQISITAAEVETEEDIEGKTEEAIPLSDIFQPPPEEEESLLKKVDSVYSRLDKLSLNELLEIDEKANSETVKKNYYRLAKEFHPDRFFTLADASMKTKLTAVFDAVTNAYDTLKDDKKRAEYYKSLATPEKEINENDKIRAEEQFKRGISEFKKGNFWGSIDNFKWAVKMMPKNSLYWSYLSLAYSKIPGRLKDAEDALLKAIEHDPVNSNYYANLGLIYIKAGLKKRALANFQKALKLNPNNEKAKKGLEQTKE